MEFKILIVDDSKAARFMLQRMLQKIEIQIELVKHAANGSEALKLIEQEQFDLIFSDMVMPEMDGFSLIKHLKNSKYASIPIIPITSLGAKKDIQIFKQNGVLDFLTKPVSIENLGNAIFNTLKLDSGKVK